MISKTDILKMTKHVFHRAQGVRDRRLMHPRREWTIILLVTILVIIAGAGASTWRYLTYDQTQIAAESPATAAVSYQVNTVSRALQTYAARREQFAQRLSAAPAPSGPPATSTDATSTPSTLNESAATTNTLPAPVPSDTAPDDGPPEAG